MKEIILNDYMQNIYFGFDEFLFFLELKHVWQVILVKNSNDL
jgi:hypothetical protein